MTVADLIEALVDCPLESLVLVGEEDSGFGRVITGVEYSRGITIVNIEAEEEEEE